MKEKISEQIKRLANLPHVVEKRRRLKALYYLATRNKGSLTLSRTTINARIANVVHKTPTIVVHLNNQSGQTEHLLFLYPMESFTFSGESPDEKL